MRNRTAKRFMASMISSVLLLNACAGSVLAEGLPEETYEQQSDTAFQEQEPEEPDGMSAENEELSYETAALDAEASDSDDEADASEEDRVAEEDSSEAEEDASGETESLTDPEPERISEEQETISPASDDMLPDEDRFLPADDFVNETGEENGLLLAEAVDPYSYEYLYEIPFSGENANNQILRGESRGFSANLWFDALDPDTKDWMFNGETPIVSVETVRNDTWNEETQGWDPADEDLVWVEYRENEQWYEIHGIDLGRTILKITWLVPGTKDEISEEKEVFIKENTWSLDWDFENGTNHLLPGETKTVSFWLGRNYVTDYGSDYEQREVRVTARDENGNPMFDDSYLSIEENGSELRITALKEAEGINTRVRVCAFTKDESGNEFEACFTYINIEAWNVYWNLLPERPQQQAYIGDTVNLSTIPWRLVRYETGEEPVEENLKGGDFRLRLEDYDGNAWIRKGKADVLLPSLQRVGEWGTDVRVVVEELSRDDRGNIQKDANGDPEYHYVTDRHLWFDGMDYDLWFGSEELRGRDWTWVFDNEKQTIRPQIVLPDGKKLSDTSLKIEWAIGDGRYDDEKHCFEYPLDPSIYTISSDMTSLTIDGAKWKKLTGTRDAQIRVSLWYADREIRDSWTHVDLRDVQCWVDVPDDTQYRLPGWDEYIDKYTHGYIENAAYPDGEDREVILRSLQVKILEGEADAVIAEEEENGWNLRMNDYGHAVVTMTWDSMDPKMDPGTSSFDIYVQRKTFWIDTWTQEETEDVIPGSSLHMHAQVRAEFAEEGSGDTSDYTLKWTILEGNDLISLQKGPDTDRSVTIQAKEQGEDFRATDAIVGVTSYDPSGKEVCTTEVRIGVRNYFTKLILTDASQEGEVSLDPNRLPLGKAVLVRPLVKEYASALASDTHVPVDGNDITGYYRFAFEWNPGQLKITDRNGADLDGKDPESYEGQKEFYITRIGVNGTDLRIRGEYYNQDDNYWEEGARYDRWLDDIDLNNQIYFYSERPRGWGDYTWVFEDETLTLKLLSEGAVDDLSVFDIDWQIGTDYEEESGTFRQVMDSSVVSLDKQNKTISINGAAWKARRERLEESGQEDPFSWNFQIHLIFRYQGEWVDDLWTHVDFRYNDFDWEDSKWRTLVPTQNLRYDDGEVSISMQNAEYPYGKDMRVKIDSIVSDDEQVVKCVHTEEGWFVEPQVSGIGRGAELTFTVSGGELKAPYTFTHYVEVTDLYYDLRVYTDEPDEMIPGQSRQLKVELYRYTYDETDGQRYFEVVDPARYQTEYQVNYNEHVFHVDQNGLVTTEKTSDYWDTEIRVKVKTRDKWEEERNYRLQLTDYYTEVIADPYHADKGQTIRPEDLGAAVMEYTEKYPNGRKLEDMTIRFNEPNLYQKDYLTLQNDGTLKATADASLIKKGEPADTGVEVIAYGPTGRERGRGWAEITICDHNYKLTKTVAATCLKAGEKSYTCTDCGKVKKVSIAKLKATAKLNATSIKLKVKQSTTAVEVTGLAKGDSVASWTSNKTAIATVDKKSGKITGKKAGSATITVTLKSGLKKTVKVTVQKGEVAATKISGVKSSLSLKKGKSLTLKPVIAPITCVQKVSYTSSNKKVAVVSAKGKITAKGKGTATITIKCGKKSFKCKVTVK